MRIKMTATAARNGYALFKGKEYGEDKIGKEEMTAYVKGGFAIEVQAGPPEAKPKAEVKADAEAKEREVQMAIAEQAGVEIEGAADMTIAALKKAVEKAVKEKAQADVDQEELNGLVARAAELKIEGADKLDKKELLKAIKKAEKG